MTYFPFNKTASVEEYSVHTGVIENFATTNLGTGSSATVDASNHELDLATGTNSAGFTTYFFKPAYSLSTSPLVLNVIFRNFYNGSGGTDKYTIIGLDNSLGNSFGSNYVALIYRSSNGDWRLETYNGSLTTTTLSSQIGNGDLVTIIAELSRVYVYKNGTPIAISISNISNSVMSPQVKQWHTGTLSIGQIISVDYMGIKVYR